MRFLVLGPLAAVRDGVAVQAAGRREIHLLAGLLAHRNEVVPVARLARLVWDAEGEPSRNALQARVSHLRRSLGLEADRLTFVGDGYRLRVGAGESDDEDVADAVGQAQALLGAGQAAAARDLLDTALDEVRGEPYAPVGEHPFTLAAVVRARELVWSARELRARAALEAGDAVTAAAQAAGLVAEQPLRQDARVVLMRALDAQGRRAEALATYDDARRRLAAERGLEPSAVLRATHADILRTERTQTRVAAAGPGVLEPPEMIVWLGENGHVDAALRLAVRCAWGWWLAGDRGRGRRLLLDLLDAAGSARPSASIVRAARLWAAALAAHERDEAHALADADRATPEHPDTEHPDTERPAVDEIEALALVLLAKRRIERGEHEAATRLLMPARIALQGGSNAWGQGLVELVTAWHDLLRGAADEAEVRGRASLAMFHELADPAGQLSALDLLGYAAEIRGDWRAAVEHHQRALLLALHGGWLHSQCLQLLRLGSVTALAGQPAAGRQRLVEAIAVARRLESPSLLAFARSALAAVDARSGDAAAAARGHRRALDWFRRAGSISGVAFNAAALARVAPADEAPGLLAASWDAALASRDPRALAFTAESRALNADDAAAYHLGVADGLRSAASRPRVPGEQPSVDRVAGRVAGSDEHDRGRRDGVALAREIAAPPGPSCVTGSDRHGRGPAARSPADR